MANFLPLKNYMFFCLEQFIVKYGLSPPFLDVGCGIGDLSKYVAAKGWSGKAIDSSNIAIDRARQNLASFQQVEIEKKSLFEETGNFKTIFLWDVMEHIKNDDAILEKISSLLSTNGHVLISVPTNPKKWRWDDDFYGHYRRYTVKEIRRKILDAGLNPLAFWDFTYPFFEIMRKIYTKLKSVPRDFTEDKEIRTNISSTVNAWDIPFVSRMLSCNIIPWSIVYKIQFSYFKNRLERGYGMFILSKKYINLYDEIETIAVKE